MHSTEIEHTDRGETGVWTIHHNGDYSGDVLIDFGDHECMDMTCFRIPFAVLEELVGRKMISDRISQLEDQSGREFIRGRF